MSKSLYDILGIPPTATSADIKKAYRTKAQRLHPDKETGDEGAFKELLEAYEVLMDDARRRYYDENGEIPAQEQQRFISEAIGIVLHLIDNVDSVKTVNLLSAASDIVKRAINKARNTKEAIQEQIAERKEAASRLSCLSGENILGQAILANIAIKEKELQNAIALEQEGNDILALLGNYRYRAEVIVRTQTYAHPFAFLGGSNGNTRL